MKKEIKNFEKIVGIVLVILTIISLMISALHYTHLIYDYSYDTTSLNALLVSKPFDILLWVDNILIYLFGLFYIISAIQSKKEVLIKVSFSIFSIVTTMVASCLIINGIASIFHIF